VAFRTARQPRTTTCITGVSPACHCRLGSALTGDLLVAWDIPLACLPPPHAYATAGGTTAFFILYVQCRGHLYLLGRLRTCASAGTHTQYLRYLPAVSGDAPATCLPHLRLPRAQRATAALLLHHTCCGTNGSDAVWTGRALTPPPMFA